MICGLPAISFFIMCILWPCAPIAAVICGLLQDKKSRQQEENG